MVIALGNALRHDDAAGLAVMRKLRARPSLAGVALCEHEGETLALLDLWAGAGAVVLIDAASSGAQAGTIHRFDASFEPIPAWARDRASTHAVDLGEAIELARALGRLPARTIVYALEGQRFDAGSGLSEDVQAAIAVLADTVLDEVRRLATPGTTGGSQERP